MVPAKVVSTRSARRLKRDRFVGLLRAHEARLRRLCHGMLTDRARVDVCPLRCIYELIALM